MKPGVLVLCLAFAAHAWAAEPSPYAIEIPKWFSESFLDLREDIADAKRQDKRLLIYFGQDGCPYCKALMKVTFGDAAIAARTRKQFVPVALNLWGDREVTWVDGRHMTEKELARMLRVQFTPTLLFFDEEGHVVLRLNGYSPPEKFRVALDYAGARLEKRQSYTDFVAGRPEGKIDFVAGEGAAFERASRDFPRILQAGKPVIALFERKSCRDCAELHREAFARPDVAAELEKFRVVQLDLLGAREMVAPEGKRMSERDWARSLQVTNTPSLVFFDGAGKEVFRAEGYLRPFHVASVLDYVASGAYRDEPSFQRFIQARADALRARGVRVELWE